tara:strand:- start:199 stop:855 length:657 start_codon:yes stop_codon:yes gene_type:complete
MNVNFEKARELMVENQLRPNKIREEKILNVFKNVPKEIFVKPIDQSICYSDKDFNISIKRGYLKNLHLAQIITNAKIKNTDKVLHVGGLTGYLSVIIGKICNQLVVLENEENNISLLKNNFTINKLDNIKIVNGNLDKGFDEESPYDLIIIDCPIYHLNKIFIDQLSKEGRLIYIEKINNELAKAYKIIKTKGSFSKEYLFDVFSEFSIDKKNEEFEF